MGGDNVFVRSCQITDRVDFKLTQSLRAGFAAHIQGGYGKRPHFLFNFMGVKGMNLIRLSKIGCHLCKYLPVGNPDVDCKPKSISDFILHLRSSSKR